MSSGDTSETGDKAATKDAEHKAQIDKAVDKAIKSTPGKK